MSTLTVARSANHRFVLKGPRSWPQTSTLDGAALNRSVRNGQAPFRALVSRRVSRREFM